MKLKEIGVLRLLINGSSCEGSQRHDRGCWSWWKNNRFGAFNEIFVEIIGTQMIDGGMLQKAVEVQVTVEDIQIKEEILNIRIEFPTLHQLRILDARFDS